MKNKQALFLIFILTMMAPGRVAAELGGGPKPAWNKSGLEINNSLGNSPQRNPKMIAVAGGYFMVWEDSRNGYTNLFAQKLDDAGKRLWGADGVEVAKADGNQTAAMIVKDKAEGLIIVWQDYRSGNADIYAQKINAQGSPQWGAGGIAVSKAAAGQLAPQMIADGSGGIIITWHDYRGAAGEDIYAQRINSEGKELWQKDGIPVCVSPGTQWYPKIAADGAGGAVIVWTDGRTSSADNSIYAQRISPAGQALWEKDGIPVCSALQNQERPVLVMVEGGVIVAWNDWRTGNCDIYSQKIDFQGKALWQKDGIAVVAAPFSQEEPKLENDGSGGAVVLWVDSRSEETSVFMQRLSSEGKILWGSDGRPLCKNGSKQENPDIILSSDDGFIASWEDYRSGKPALFAQKISPDGVALWQDKGIPLIKIISEQQNITVVAGPKGSAVAAWQDKRQGNFDIYAQMLSPDGNLVWGNEGAVVCKAIGAVVHENASLVNSGPGEIIVVFEDARAGFSNIYAQKIGRNGVVAWDKDGIAVAKSRADQSDPQVVTDGAGGAYIFWVEKGGENELRVAGQRLNSAGKKIWEDGSVYLTKIISKQSGPRAIPDGSGGAIVVWQDERNPLSFKDLYGQRLSPAGEVLWNANGLLICGENGDQTEAEIASDGSGRFFTAWTDYRRGERNPDIYAQMFDAAGKLAWEREGATVCGAPDIQRAPHLAADTEGVFIVWTDKGGGSYDIYGQRLSRQGKALWVADGIPISQAGRTQQNPILANSNVVVWEDYRFGNWDVMANSVTLQGKLSWGEAGASVSVLDQTQYSPQAISLKDGSTVVAWEDYRNNKQYEIYMQKMMDNGKAAWQENGFPVNTRNGARAPKLSSIKEQNALVIIWEDFTKGGRAIYGQKFLLD